MAMHAVARVTCNHVGRIQFHPRTLKTVAPRPSVAVFSTMTAMEKILKYACEGSCSKDTPKVPPEEVPELLTAVPSWNHDAQKSMLTRKFTAKNFMAAMRFFNKVAEVAESEGHHPDLHLTNYRDVEVNIYTHAAGGLTMMDFGLAVKLDEIDIEYSPKWLKQQQELQQQQQQVAQQ